MPVLLSLLEIFLNVKRSESAFNIFFGECITNKKSTLTAVTTKTNVLDFISTMLNLFYRRTKAQLGTSDK